MTRDQYPCESGSSFDQQLDSAILYWQHTESAYVTGLRDRFHRLGPRATVELMNASSYCDTSVSIKLHSSCTEQATVALTGALSDDNTARRHVRQLSHCRTRQNFWTGLVATGWLAAFTTSLSRVLQQRSVDDCCSV
ncbi:hypothetical protein BaRGS_00015109 [Batillaria attramentaria]|uniref:Uncharacterized protein n=1 Tax=Batillaria attramentaria TaxID=370345 RepID=A0ABD0L2K7_9CAEN